LKGGRLEMDEYKEKQIAYINAQKELLKKQLEVQLLDLDKQIENLSE